MSKMMRFNETKPKLSYILEFPKAMAETAKVMEFGAEKYDRHNWKKGGSMSEQMDSLIRHAVAFQNGEDSDEESGRSHLAHIICNAAFLLENYERFGGKFDDRDWGNY